MTPIHSERGMTLVEVLIAIVVLTAGVLALGRMIPAATRGQASDKMLTQANAYAQQKIEDLQTVPWAHPDLADGRHPPSGDEPLGSNGQWQRHYQISTMAAPLDNLRKVVVTVDWSYLGSRSVTATTYMRR